MSEFSQKIVYYENLLQLKRKSNQKLHLSDVNNWEICRTCLRETTEDGVELEKKCVMDLQAGRFLNVQEVLIKLAKLEAQRQVDELPVKVCQECFEKIKTFYHFSVQVGNAENILKLLAHKLKTDKNQEETVIIKSEETPTSEEFLFVIDENSQTIELSNNRNILKEDAGHVPNVSNSFKNANKQLMENNQIVVKKERELIIDDIQLCEEVDIKNELMQAVNLLKGAEQFHITEIYNPEDDTDLNRDLVEKLPKVLDNQCLVCQEVFDNAPELVDHAKRLHSKAKVFKCRHCSAVFTHISSLYRHYRYIHQKQTNIKLESSRAKHKKLDFFDKQCAECKKFFYAKEDLVKHAKLYHPRTKAFKCRDCTMVSLSIYSLCQHFKRTHQIQPKTIKREFPRRMNVQPSTYFDSQCALCPKKFLRQTDFIKHVKAFHPKEKALKCHDCSMHFTTMKALIIHNREIHKQNLIRKKYICEMCSQACYSNADLRNHLRIHTGERPFPCPLCDWTFSLRTSLKGHLKTHEREPKILKKMLACEFCPKTFDIASRLKLHLATHTGERPYTCDVCDRAFGNKRAMNDHHKRIHLKLSKSRGKYKYKDSVDNLVEESEQTKIENICAVCNRKFKLKRDLIKHGNHLHPNADIFKCPKCSDIFAKHLALTNHFNRHHKSWPTKHACHLCTKSFFSRYDLKSHIMVHTGERPYACPLCDKSYTKQITLRWHQKKNHSSSSEILVPSKESKRSLFECQLCLKKFQNTSIFKRHLRVHTGDSTFTCSLWEKAYDLMKHQTLPHRSSTKTKEKSIKTEKKEDKPSPLNSSPANNVKRIIFNCNECPKVFLTKAGMNKHVIKNHPDPTATDTTEEETNWAANESNDFKEQKFNKDVATEILTSDSDDDDVCLATLKLKREVDMTEDNFNTTSEYLQLDTQFECDNCIRKFKSLAGLKCHQRHCKITEEHK